MEVCFCKYRNCNLGYLVHFYSVNGDIIKKDVSLTGGTTITVYEKTDLNKLQTFLSKEITDFSVRTISDLTTGNQIAFIVETPEDVHIIRLQCRHKNRRLQKR